MNMLSEGHSVVHYGSCEFTFEGKNKAEFVEWTEKNIDEEITLYLQHHLSSRSVQPAEMACVQVVVGGDHGDTAFQCGASISVELNDARIIDCEVSVCKLICPKDTGKLNKQYFHHLPMVSRLLQQCLFILRLTNTAYSNAGSAALLQLETETPLQK